MDEKQKNTPFKAKTRGIKGERRKQREFTKKSTQDKAGFVSAKRHGASKAFAITKVQKAERLLRRTQDMRVQKTHMPQVRDDIGVHAGDLPVAPSIVAVVGAQGVGKSTVLLGLVRSLTHRNIVPTSTDSTSLENKHDDVRPSNLSGPITLTLGTKNRITLLECAPDLNSMADVAKVADVVVLVMHAGRGMEMETLELLHLLKAHGMPRVVGVLTHLDKIRNDKPSQLWMKKLKRRFLQEVKEKYIRLSRFNVRNHSYNPYDLQTLGRCVVEKLARVTDWRREHGFLLADHFEDITDLSQSTANPMCDHRLAFYGYIRGTKMLPNSFVHVPGVGDFQVNRLERVTDPCPVLPRNVKRDETGKRIRGARGQRLKQRKIYAPLSGIGSAVYLGTEEGLAHIDMGAVTAGQNPTDGKTSTQPGTVSEAEALLQLGDHMRQGLESQHTVQLFEGGPWIPADTGQHFQKIPSNNDTEEEEDETDVSDEEKMELGNMSNDEMDTSGVSSEESEIDEEDDLSPLEHQFGDVAENWESIPVQTDLNRVIYDEDFADPLYSTTGFNKSHEEDEFENLFTSARRLPASQHDLLVPQNILNNTNVDQALHQELKARFAVSADWNKNEKEDAVDDDDESDEEKDDDTDEVNPAAKRLAAKKARKRERNAAIFNMAPNPKRKKGEEEESDEKPFNLITEGRGKFFEAAQNAVVRQSQFNEEALAHLSEDARAEIEGYPVGTYVRAVLSGFPVEFVHHFNAAYPVILGCLKSREQEEVLLHANYLPHRWFPKQIRCGDPLIISCGWRRYQTRPVFCRRGDDGRLIVMKYSPPQVPCYITFHGFVVPEKTGYVAFQTASKKEMNFRMCGTGAILRTEESADIQKRLRLKGEPFLCKGKTTFIRGMFKTSAEVLQFAQAELLTPAGVRGQVKKPVKTIRQSSNSTGYMKCQDGDFRATFEHPIDVSHIVYLKTWVKYPVPRILLPVDNLCLPDKEREDWQAMRNLSQVRRDLGLPSLAESASKTFYEEVERKPFFPKELRVPQKLEARLPYAFKSKIKINSKQNKESKVDHVADLHLPDDVETSQQKRRERLLMQLALIERNLLSTKRDKMRERAVKHQQEIKKKISMKEAKKAAT